MEKISLKAARINAGLTQDDLGKLMNVHRNTVAAWEKNPKSISIETAEKICAALKVKISNIFFG